MFLIHVLLKIKEVKTGWPERRTNLSFLEVVHNLYMVQINIWIRFHRCFTCVLIVIHFNRNTEYHCFSSMLILLGSWTCSCSLKLHLANIPVLYWMLDAVLQALARTLCHEVSPLCQSLQRMFMRIRFSLHLNGECLQWWQLSLLTAYCIQVRLLIWYIAQDAESIGLVMVSLFFSVPSDG